MSSWTCLFVRWIDDQSALFDLDGLGVIRHGRIHVKSYLLFGPLRLHWLTRLIRSTIPTFNLCAYSAVLLLQLAIVDFSLIGRGKLRGRLEAFLIYWMRFGDYWSSFWLGWAESMLLYRLRSIFLGEIDLYTRILTFIIFLMPILCLLVLNNCLGSLNSILLYDIPLTPIALVPRATPLSLKSLEVVHLPLVYILEADHYPLNELLFIQSWHVALANRMRQVRGRCQFWVVPLDELHSMLLRFRCSGCDEGSVFEHGFVIQV